MNVTIKKFDVDMEVKNRGVEFEVRTPSGDHLGDLVLTKAKLIWCPGRSKRDNGIETNWQEFIDWVTSK